MKKKKPIYYDSAVSSSSDFSFSFVYDQGWMRT